MPHVRSRMTPASSDFQQHADRSCRALPPAPRIVTSAIAQRPHRGAAHQRACVVEQPLGLRCQRRIAGVADRDQHIANEAVAADALDRRFREQRAKRRVVEPRQSASSGARNASRAASFASRPSLRELVPRADRKAIVAAIDAVADGFAEFVRDRSLVLDREIGNAAPRIELVGRRKRRRRTDVEAGPAGAAMVGLGARRAAGRAW